MTIKRLKKELLDISKSTDMDNISMGTVNDNLYHWEATIFGLTDCPYEGGVFKLDIIFPNDYPYKPPKIKFLTKIYHPNISPDGKICIDILNDNWSSVLTISKAILSICSLLNDPNPNDPLVPDIATEYLENYDNFYKTAKNWTIKYAN